MLLQGDCLERLAELADESVDSLVTDPPAGISFMGKDWDDDKGGRAQWVAWLSDVMRECLRVLKPGAHGLVWAIPRTSHWTMTALEEAGFEVRDVITHLFGTGFPKSLDVSKAIDKAAGAEPEVVGSREVKSGGKTFHGVPYAHGETLPITAPATEAAKKWHGWGTALKPAAEFWILVRKPLGEKTVAANVLKHGTGAVNVDGARIGTTETLGRQGLGRFPANVVLSHSPGCCEPCGILCKRPNGCVPGCSVAELDRQSGSCGASGKSTGAKPKGSTFSQGAGQLDAPFYASGGASRFFYCAKASKKDRGAENKHPTVKSTALMSYLIRLVTPPGGVVLDPFMGSGSTGVAAKREGFRFVGIEMQAEYFETARTRLA